MSKFMQPLEAFQFFKHRRVLPVLRVLRVLRVLLACLLCSAFGLHGSSYAQSNWPNKPVRIIVPFAAGSFTETAARAIAAELSNQMGQPFIVETKGGAGSTLGTDVVAKSAPDGYTLLVTDNSYAVSSALYPKLPYDPDKDIQKISTIAEAPAVIMVKSDAPYKTLKDLVDAAQKQPKALTYGSGGQGSSAHLAIEWFLSSVNAEMTHIPYKGVAAALVDLMAGRIDVGLASAGSSAQHIKGGRLRGLAVVGKERHSLIPEVPTFTEAGYGNYQMVYWFGLMAPAHMPPAVVQRLQQGVARAVEQPKVMEVFASTGAKAVASTSAEFTKKVDDESRIWKAVVAKAGIKVE
jgi:tripartite-type tricarboxylate transporter receptor subunit TctC